jgi:hypothetical protein
MQGICESEWGTKSDESLNILGIPKGEIWFEEGRPGRRARAQSIRKALWIYKWKKERGVKHRVNQGEVNWKNQAVDILS